MKKKARRNSIPSAPCIHHVYVKALVQFKFGDKIIFQNMIVTDMRVDAVLV